MDIVSFLLSAVLFYAFVPGVLLRLPAKSSFRTSLLVHSVLFAGASSLVMWYYWTKIRERFGNHGAGCPVTHLPTNANVDNCVPNCPPGGCERGIIYGQTPKTK